jgi:hypothetical protein
VGVLIALLLIAEAAWTLSRVAGLVYTIAAYDPIAILLIAARAIVAAMQASGGALVLQRRPPAAAIARTALLASAMLRTLEAGFRLAPSGVPSFWRWEIVTAYWMYALAGAWWLSRPRRS